MRDLSLRCGIGLCTAVGLLAGSGQASATQFYLTGFDKTANIYNNLNQQYPHTDIGTGTPGSPNGTPNASFLYNPATYTSPNAVAGANQTTNDTTFLLTSDALGRDYAELNGASRTLAINQTGVQTVSILGAAYFGTSARFTLTGADGTTQVFNNNFFPDFNSGVSTPLNDTTADGALRQTTFLVDSVGAGGSGNSTNGARNRYNITEFTLNVSAALRGQSLASLTVFSPGATTTLFAATAVTADAPPPPTRVPEPATLALLGAGLVGVAAARRRTA